ncbi:MULTISPECIES: ParB/Srx family N-terminal domain-containing protein [unclassified Caballeronia]|uniref:ParB/Srx family N-terminal domain-containing protein n=1 Tax=unclassified Caballeronia TaxID=2646786 RepID=UPI002857410E|nr:MULTISPECIES: ParB/Srx family N-terminal domain-containing protein [unclassified Caballeronia]MDR5739528.1 ParB/Srx family N-terminal domain-containing protein [Caballeronia sp. LZ016]MDR5807996.1 ParB/Srx family N-terminal domain-containing protein [Caballeronia sp. LZ019]
MDEQAFARIDELRPTQGALGMEHVREKMRLTSEQADGERAAFMQEHALCLVRGPGGTLHVIDHHHWARAWHELGVEVVPVKIARDFSDRDHDAFLAAMREEGWLHPFDAQGNETSVEALPPTLGAMPDDPYLSLAAFARMAGVFEDSPEFNAKFAWADYFRERIDGDFTTTSGFAKALAQAVAASREDEARELPGFKA